MGQCTDPEAGDPSQEPGPTCDVQVFLARPDQQDERDLDQAWTLLDAHERAQADRFYFASDRLTYVVAHGLLRSVLARHAGKQGAELRFLRTRFGRPELDGSEGGRDRIRFSLSHSRGLVGCAVTLAVDVGLDVEAARRPAPLDVAERYFAEKELSWLRARLPPEQDDWFYALWTLKEAYMKGVGLGLALPLQSFGVQPTPEGSARLLLPHPEQTEPGPWTLRWWRLERHWTALAVRAPANNVRIELFQDHRIKASGL